jgi:HEAT repeat protein
VVAATPALVGEEEAVGLEAQLASEIVRQSAKRLQGWRIKSSSELLKSPATAFPAGTWRTLQATFEPNFEQVKELFAQNSDWNGQGTAITYPSRLAPFSANVSLSVVEDALRGSVLKMSESSEVRSGGFTLPYKDIDPVKTPFLTFWVKTTSRDNLALFADEGGSQMREIHWSAVHDGSWQAVTVDLRGSSSATIKSLALGAPRKESEREQIGEIAYQFDDFQLSDSGQATPPVDAATLAIVKKALDARSMSAAELAKESRDFVILIGLIERISPFTAADEAGLMQLSKSVNVRIAGLALRRLADLGTPTAKAEVLRLITASPFDHVKRVAAELVANFGDPKLAGILSRLYASPSWQNRMAGARAIASMSGDETEVIAMTFLQELDPQVRLTVTKFADPNNAVVRKRFLWSAVNDPSDAVRTESAWRLIHSNTASAVAEGYKLIRDDSVGVRLELLRRFQLEPSPAHLGAIRIALADSSPRVRAAALRALSAQPADVALDEIANVFEDKFPVVQNALLDLAAAKKLTLPSAAIASLKSSIDKTVAARAGDE